VTATQALVNLSSKIMVMCVPRPECGACPLAAKRGRCPDGPRERRRLIQQLDLIDLKVLRREKTAAERRYAEAKRAYDRQPGRSVGKYGYDRAKRELTLLRNERAAAVAACKEKEEYVRRLHAAGAAIEEGAHTVVIERRRRAGMGCPVEYDLLRVC
jgi:hypothetical protein